MEMNSIISSAKHSQILNSPQTDDYLQLPHIYLVSFHLFLPLLVTSELFFGVG